jgi:sortase (surface protein transpeptidase)
MTRSAVRPGERPWWRAWAVWGVLSVLAVAGLAFTVRPLGSERPAERAALPPRAAAAAGRLSPGPAVPPGGTPVVTPRHLTIPTIGVSTQLEQLGMRADQTVEVPRNASRAGWFDLGPVPGRLGASVVLGHVDSVEGPAVFYRLSQLRPGDRVRVRLSDGSVVRFAVRKVATYANADFPARRVYAGAAGRRELNLVTCGGWYDEDRGGWQGNVVVFAELVGAPGS